MSYTLRTYQEEAVRSALNAKKNELLVLPTGSGKSLVISEIARSVSGRVLVLQPSKEILEQNLEKLHAYDYYDVGVYSASMRRKDRGHITLATVGSIHKRLDEFQDIELIIIDEAHAVNPKGGMYKTVIETLGVQVIGLTATPYRLHSYEDFRSGQRAVVAKLLTRTRPREFSGIAHITQVQELFSAGYLAMPEYHISEGYDHSEIKLNSTGMDFDREALQRYNEQMDVVGAVVEALNELDARHILVFAVFVEEAVRIAEALEHLGIRAVSISADTGQRERDEIVRAFRAGEIQVVTNVGVLTTGFDYPELDCVVMARPTQSVALYYQMIGRGLRPYEGKTYHVVDVCGNVRRFGAVETFDFVETDTGLRLRSNAGYLTGFDFVNNEDLEARDYRGKRETTGQNNNKIWHIGKHKGTHVSKLPQSYLEWVVDNFSDGAPRRMAEAELERRILRHSSF